MKTEKGLVLISHGSRVKKAADEMQQLVKFVQAKLGDYSVKEAYMEIQSPNLMDTIKSFADEGFKEIDVLPLFFFEGRHMRDDIPAQVEECQEIYKECSIKLLPHIGGTEVFANALVESVLTL